MLAKAFLAHLDQTKGQVERVEGAFADTGKKAKAKKCEAMAGLIEEAGEMMEVEADPEVMDAVLSGLAQKVEHYQTATYGTLCTWAETLGYKKAKTALGANLDEEEATDKKLTELSRKIDRKASA